MKNLKFYVAITFLSVVVFFISCSDHDMISEKMDNTDHISINTQSDFQQAAPLPEDVKKAVKVIGGHEHDFGYIEITAFSTEPIGFVVYNDVLLKKEEFLQRAKQVGNKQYRTEFLVNVRKFKTVDLFVYTGEPVFDIIGLKQSIVTQIQNAAQNWNAARSKLVFTVTVSSDISQFSTAIHETILAAVDFASLGIDASGIAEFPTSDGAPGTIAAIDSPLNTIADFIEPKALEHLFTHELGHTIGFRHSDWDTRRSCVDLGIEPFQTTEENAQRIFGTYSTFIFQDDSVMNACFADNTTSGNPNFADETSLRRLYGFRF
jgi:hypothetical protein